MLKETNKYYSAIEELETTNKSLTRKYVANNIFILKRDTVHRQIQGRIATYVKPTRLEIKFTPVWIAIVFTVC